MPEDHGAEAAAPEDGGLTDPEIAAAVGRLDELPARPPEEHADVYDEVHEVLHRALEEAARSERQ